MVANLVGVSCIHEDPIIGDTGFDKKEETPKFAKLENALSGKHLVWTRDGHADIFGDAHRCVCWIYPTYVGYSAILSDNAEVDADIRIRIAIPSLDV